MEYRAKIPEAGRLDFAMGVLREDVPVIFRITAIPDGAEGGEPTALFEEHYAVKEAWGQRSVDLADFAGQTVTLGLEAESETQGQVALWGAPTVTGGGQSPLPNVVFYVFDGGAADYMSVYGYNRRTTPTLERLASEGVVFERAYSNSSWTLPSTASFMTSLQTRLTRSLRGGGFNPLPAEAVTMAEHMHRAGYQTAVFTGNPNAGTLSDLQPGVDLFREDWEDFSYFGGNNHKESSSGDGGALGRLHAGSTANWWITCRAWFTNSTVACSGRTVRRPCPESGQYLWYPVTSRPNFHGAPQLPGSA